MGIRRAFGRISMRLSEEERGWLIVEVMIMDKYYTGCPINVIR